jgi:nickel-dependent lactate racemase
VPHEVVGMANHAKNIFVGVGGVDFINKSHYLGASYGMERIMGRAGGPVRAALEYARTRFIGQLPIIYILTVRASENGRMVTKGLFVGDDFECFERAVELSRKVNFVQLDREIHKCVVYLDPAEFKSTWLGNKAIYRTRMALADNAELLILAPGLCEFGEDAAMDALIRRFGYRGTPHTLAAVASEADLRANLGAAAHLIHGSSEGRFGITYAPGGGLTREDIEGVGFGYADLQTMLERYDPAKLRDGWNTLPGGEEIFYISNPALGLWAYRDRFKD